MSDCLYKTRGAYVVIPAWPTRAPLGALSCRYSLRDAVRRQVAEPRLHQRFRLFGPNRRGASRAVGPADHHPWSTDYWNPPVTPSQHGRQRALALIVAVVLAALLAHVGW